MAYVKIIFQNSPSTATPMNAQNLNHMDDQIALNDQRLTEIETSYVKSFNGRTGAISPADNDYNIGQIAPLSGAQVGQVPVVVNHGTEEDPELVFEMGAGGGGGHSIIDSEGTQMPQETAMQFADSFVSDDDVNGRTVVENVKEVASADYSSETEDGMYLIPDGEGAVIHPSSEDYVEVTADGNTTRRDLFNWLFNHCDTSKIRENAYIVYSGNGRIYHYEDINNGTYIFAWESIRATTIEKVCLQLNSSTSTEIDWTLATTGNTKEENYSYKPANGYKYTLYYGNKKATVDLQTTANRCVTSDGGTVQQALDNMFGIINVPIAGTVISHYYGEVSTGLDTSIYTAIGLCETGAWDENCNYTIGSKGSSIHIKCHLQSYTIPNGIGALKVIYVKNSMFN